MGLYNFQGLILVIAKCNIRRVWQSYNGVISLFIPDMDINYIERVTFDEERWNKLQAAADFFFHPVHCHRANIHIKGIDGCRISGQLEMKCQNRP